jgi:hypothetical protein
MASASMVAACTGGGGASVAAGAVSAQPAAAAPKHKESRKRIGRRDEDEKTVTKEPCVGIIAWARRKTLQA